MPYTWFSAQKNKKFERKLCVRFTTNQMRLSRFSCIDFQIINFTRPEGGDNTNSISPTDNAVKLFIWKSIAQTRIYCQHNFGFLPG